MLGTIANTGAIITGSCIGLMIHSRLSERMIQIIFQGLGLCTFMIGAGMALRSENMLLIVISIVLGSIIGQIIDIDKYIRCLAEYIQRQSSRSNPDKEADASEQEKNKNRFTEGFLTASMMFCIGSMAILGAIEDGMGETPNLLFTKSIMDGISSVAFASSFGIAILFSSIPVFFYQGGLTLFAAFLMNYMSEGMITDLTAVGGILLIGVAINILKIKEIQVTNMLPSLIIILFLSWLTEVYF